MTWHARALLLVALALGALAFAGVASADQLIFEPAGAIRASGSMRFTSGFFFSVTCEVTLEGSFRRGSFERVAGTQVGEVARGAFSGCSTGSGTALTARPWAITYSSISGGYPEEATALGLEAVSAQIQYVEAGATCLYSGNIGLSFELRADETYSEAWRMQSAAASAPSLRLVSGTGVCPSTATATGTLRLAAAQQARRRVARLDILTTPMPAGVTTESYIMENFSPNGEPDATITSLSLIRRVGTADAPERFTIPPAENRCPGERLRARELNTCQSNVRFVGLEGERQRFATVRIEWNNGQANVQNQVPVIAER